MVEQPKKAPKIHREDCQIDWHQPLDAVHNHIRGLSPFPTAWTLLDDKTFKIYKVDKTIATHQDTPGQLYTDDTQTLKVAVPGGYITLLEVQLEGKKKMGAKEFLRGYPIKNSHLQ